MPEIIQSGGGVEGLPRIVQATSEVEPFAAPAPATGTGTSTGTTALAVASVTGVIVPGSTVTGTGVPAGTMIVSGPLGGGAGNYVTNVATTLAGVALTFTPGSTVAYFPAFVPIVPPPVFGLGGGPPPTFPPPTPPPIGAIPPGVQVGPAIAPAAVPPSVAGFPQPQFKTGSATVPAANGYFPLFTTTFPVPTIVLDAANFAVANTGHIPPWTQPPPAQTASTAPIVLDGWGPGVPPGAPTAPGSDGRFPRSMMGMMVSGEDVTTTTWKPEPEEVEAEPEPEPEPEPRRPPPRRRR